MADTLVFESSHDLKVYQKIWGLDRLALDLETWLFEQGKMESAENRLKIAKSFTRTELPAEDWLKAIELLRHSLILNEEQVRFCFEHLPQTHKNRNLRDCFFFYLNSPLAKDPVQFLWDEIGEIQKGSSPLLQNEIRFIPSFSPSYVFEEFSRLLPKSEVDSSENKLETLFPFQQASSLKSLSLLARSIKDHKSTGSARSNSPALPILIHFSGTPSHEAYFIYQLASLGMNCVSLLPPSPLLSQSSQAPSKQELKADVLLIPVSFSLVPEKALRGVFCDLSLLEPPLSSKLLYYSELEQLFFAGFRLPRPEDFKSRAFNTLKELATHNLIGAFTSIPESILTEASTIIPFELREENSSTEESLADQKEDPYWAPLGVSYLSATQLETFADCPSKYLFRRLKLGTRIIPLSDFALNFGSAVHLTLETLFTQSHTSPLTRENLLEAFRKSLSSLLKPSDQNHNISFFYEKAFEKVAPKIILLEETISHCFTPSQTLAVEKDFKIEIDGFTLIGKIDRVDLLPNDTLLILDYKTGSVTFTPEHLVKGKNFQALLYWLGAEKEFKLKPTAMLFYDLKKAEVRRGLANGEIISEESKKQLTRGHALTSSKLLSTIDAGLEQVRELGKKIRSGHFDPTPSVESCRFCDAPLFCRKGFGFE